MADYSFDIDDTAAFYAMLLEDYADFKATPLSSRFAIRCAITSWSLPDWVYKEFDAVLKPQYPDFKDYQAAIKAQCPELAIMQDIANGTKHNRITKYTPSVSKAEVHKGDFSSDFSSDFDISRLQVLNVDGTTVDFDPAITSVMNFWRDHLINDFGLKI